MMIEKDQLINRFSPVTKETWLQKINRDLKGQDISELHESISDDWKIDPFIHFEDLSPPEVNQIQFRRDSHSIALERITDTHPAAANKEALRALKEGAGALFFTSDQLTDSNLVMDGIDTQLAPVFSRQLDKTILTEDENTVISISLSHDFTESCGSWFRNIIEEDRSEFVMQVRCVDQFYHNICALRALRICWNQLMQDIHKEDTRFVIIADYDVDDDEDLAFNLQLSMPKVLAAFLGGADHIASPGGLEKNEAKWYHNLVHLLTLEAGLEPTRDTMSGSFYLEKLTNDIADRIWSSLLKQAGQK
ncbi:MAG: methylmalonyl-CoA mutase family protein [Saprospiraceae bacterium]|nr:methylmalonyl-CoA mutase family protein [Saprospiraceae bacterium]